MTSSSIISSGNYDVFISFREEDTSDNFTSRLYYALCENKIKTFIDQMDGGLLFTILNAIQSSKISVIIFSENYASSIWCLEELVTILECHKMNGQIVIPVFYHVTPLAVRIQSGSIGDAFAEWEKKNPEKTLSWRAALTEASVLIGWSTMTVRTEAKLVDKIVKNIVQILHDLSPQMRREDVHLSPRRIKKLEYVPVSKEDKLDSLFHEVCDRLDSHASTFWNHECLKQLRLKLAQVYDLLRHSKHCTSDQNVILNLFLMDLKGLPCDVDDLLDDWEQLEISRLKFNQEVRRIHEWLVRFWNSFHKLVTGPNEHMSAISELSSARSDEYTVLERDIERSIFSVKHVLLLNMNMVRIITILGMSGIGKTFLSQRIYSNEKVKTHFPLRFWFKVSMNLDFSTVVKAIEVRCCEILGAEKMLSKRLLIVLDNVCDLDDEKLDKFRLLISEMHDSGSCVLVTTRSDRVATTMRTVPARHFLYFPESDSLTDFSCELPPALRAHGHGLGHDKDQILEAPELAVMTESQRYSESATDKDPELSPEDEMTCPPPVGMLAVHESKIQLTPFETWEVEVQVPETTATPERNVQKLFRYVKDGTASKIGVHGVGGIGKTAALKALISYPEIKILFDMVILVNVSRYWNTRNIQNEVLRQLSLRREDFETDSKVAEKLLQVLNGKKFLLLLDDVWEQIDLKAMGIPVPSAENGCKILMTSRKLDVCHSMNVSKVIDLERLSWEEAWQLFCEQVGGIVQSPAIQPFARAIVEGCHGLPLLIIVTGKALMKENNDSLWEHASKKFSPPSTARVYQTEDIIQLLKFSFDQLKDDDIKSCFLYCGLFPEDHKVTISGLIEYCIQEDIISGTHADAHKRGCDIVDVLVNASLVQVTEDNNAIKMRGLIRDLALGIISSAAEDDVQSLSRAEGSQFLLKAYSRLAEPPNSCSSSSSSSQESPESNRLFIPEAHQFLLGVHAGLTEPPSEEEWKCAKMIFLMDNELYTLPERPRCFNLLTLFLQRNFRLRVIPPSFFELMTSLKVLNLSKTRIKFLPKTLVNLKRLQFLILRYCELLLALPSEVGSLECLEVLDLEGTEINKLPDEIVKLASLIYLNVFFYGSIDKNENIKLPCDLISSGTLSGLQALETLSIVVYPGDKRWDKHLKYVISEVSKLKKLSSLCFYFPEIEYVTEFLEESVAWKDQQLTEFKFVVGHDVKSIVSRVADYVQFDYNQQDRCLRFVNGKNVSPEVLQILVRSTAFYVDHHLGIDSLSNFGVSNMNGLKFVIISECPRIKTVVDTQEHTVAVFPSLENLTLNHLWNLTCIWEGIVPEGSFAMLRILSVHACQQLEYVFTSSVIQFLSKLEELTVEHCPAVKSIIVDDEIIDSSCILLPSLKKLRLHYLPELVDIWRNAWPSLEYISFYGCPNLKKIGMDSKLKDTLIWIKAEKKWWSELEWIDTEFPIHLEDRLSIFSEDEDQEP